MTSSSKRRLVVLSSVLYALALPAFGAEKHAIDRELSNHIDFRSYDFASCLEQPVCEIGNIVLHAQRLNEETGTWEPADLYWDPIDGIGVRDGAQHDEIDFDERIRVDFKEPLVVRGVWLSDLFHTEDRRYGSSGTDRVQGHAEDAEVAALRLYSEGVEIGAYSTAATDSLPWVQFNQEVAPGVLEEGDMRRRVVINEETVTLVVPGEQNGRPITQVLRLGEVDKDKQSIFNGVETVEIELGNILTEFQNAPLFAQGTTNFELIRSWAASQDEAQRIRATAENKRTSIDVSNGELRWDLDQPTLVDTVTFIAPFDASNDFSVAGILLGEGES